MNGAKTASVKSVTTDTKILDAKRVETKELLVDGVSISEIVPKWKPREHIYRCVLEKDDDYIIYDDEGNFLDCKLDTLENGTGLFQGTKGVEEFSFSLPKLTNGSNMFANCNLGEKAMESILRTIPEYSEGSHPLTMNMSADAFEKFNEITGNYSMIPGTISYKGWEIAFDAIVTLPEGYRKVEYLEGTGTQYIDTNFMPDNESGVFGRVENTSRKDAQFCGAKNIQMDLRWIALREIGCLPGDVGFNIGYGWDNWFRIIEKPKRLPALYVSETNWLNSRKVVWKNLDNGDMVVENLGIIPQPIGYSAYLFAFNGSGSPLENGGRTHF